MSVFDFTHAITLYNTEQDEDCVAVCRTGVEAGDARAQYLLGRCYYHGSGVDEDEPEAVRLVKLATAQHEPLGLHFLGDCHQHGVGGLAKDETKAAALYRQAAAYGCAEGQTNWGYMLDTGMGVPKDRAEAVRLYGLAASQGHGQGHGQGLLNAGATATEEPEKMARFFQAATAAKDQIENYRRKQSIKYCAQTAHRLTDPNHTGRHPQFIHSIRLCVDAAVAEANAASSHATATLAALGQLRNEDHDASSPACSDVTLQAGDTDLRCNRLILMASSGFFRTLFEGNFEDSKAPTVVLQDCAPPLAERLVAFIYEGLAEFASVEDATMVLEKAQYYQIDTLVAACTRYLTPRVGAYTSLLVEAVAQGPLCAPLLEAAAQCTARDFDLASAGPVFLGSSFEALATLLGKDAIHASDEDAVLDAVLRWVGHDQQARGQQLEALLDLVNLDAVSKETLAEASKSPVVRGSNMAVVVKLMDAVTAALSDDARPAKRARTA